MAFPIARLPPSADHASSTELVVEEPNCCLALGEVWLACPCWIAEMSHNITCESFPAEARVFGAVGDQASEEIGWVCATRVIVGILGFGEIGRASCRERGYV